MQIGGLLREIVNAAMDVCIHIQILVAHGVEYAKWLLSGRCIVQIDQWFTIYFPRQNGKIRSYFLYIVHHQVNNLLQRYVKTGEMPNLF